MLLKYFDKIDLLNKNEYISSAEGIRINITNKRSGKERVVYDISGDLGYNSLGHGWVNKKLKEIDMPIMLPNNFYREKEDELSDLLTQTFKFDYSFQSTTGHEAVEIFLSMNKDKNIYKLRDEFHGRTQAIVNIKEVNDFNKPLKENDALIFEPFKGKEGGFNKISEEEVEFIKASQENGAIICADEIQTSFFKVGKLLASEYYNIKPDVVLLGKPLGQGLPISAILTNDNKNFAWSSTFSGNNISTTIGIESVNEHIKRKDEFISNSQIFENMMSKVVGNSVFGFSGTFENDKKTWKDYFRNNSIPLLLNSYRKFPNKFKFLCPLVISRYEIYNTAYAIYKSIYVE